MTALKAKYRRAWITAGHGDLWNCQRTYCTVSYELLPKVRLATEDLAWLNRVSPDLRTVIEDTSTLDSGDNEIAHLESIVAKAHSLGLHLPQAFLCFMRDSSMQGLVPTCTDCFLALSEDLVPVPRADGCFVLRFLNDSQSCVMWYLCLGGDVNGAVLASSYFWEPEIFDAMEYEERGVTREDTFKEALLCADTFTEFLYRFWIENTIWYSLHEPLPLTPIQREYWDQITERL